MLSINVHEISRAHRIFFYEVRQTEVIGKETRMPLIAFSHLAQHNQTYKEHLIDAITFAGKTCAATVAFVIHGLWPAFLQRRGSTIVASLNLELQRKLNKMNKRQS